MVMLPDSCAQTPRCGRLINLLLSVMLIKEQKKKENHLLLLT